MTGATVSILMPTFARFAEGYLQRAVESVLAQSYTNFELIVVDDGSLDGSAAYLTCVAATDPRVRHLRLEKNTGLPALALAQGYKQATGDYIAWIFDDCEFRPDHLVTLVAHLDENPSHGMVYARAEARLGPDATFEIGSPFDQATLATGANFIPNVCVMLRRTTIGRVGWYDPHVLMKRLCDWDLWQRVAREFDVGFVDRVLATEHGLSLSGSLGRANDLDHSVVMKYAAQERNSRLLPEYLSSFDCFRRDFEMELSVGEMQSVEFSLFEHALQTMNEVLLERTLVHLQELGALESLQERFELQQGSSASNSANLLLLGSLGYIRRRSAKAAAAMIEAEAQTRSVLTVANRRLEHIIALQDEMASLRATADIHFAEAKRHLSSLEACTQELATARAVLADFQNAADQRLALLEESNAKVTFWSSVAEERLHLLEALRPPAPDGIESLGDTDDDKK